MLRTVSDERIISDLISKAGSAMFVDSYVSYGGIENFLEDMELSVLDSTAQGAIVNDLLTRYGFGFNRGLLLCKDRFSRTTGAMDSLLGNVIGALFDRAEFWGLDLEAVLLDECINYFIGQVSGAYDTVAANVMFNSSLDSLNKNHLIESLIVNFNLYNSGNIQKLLFYTTYHGNFDDSNVVTLYGDSLKVLSKQTAISSIEAARHIVYALTLGGLALHEDSHKIIREFINTPSLYFSLMAAAAYGVSHSINPQMATLIPDFLDISHKRSAIYTDEQVGFIHGQMKLAYNNFKYTMDEQLRDQLSRRQELLTQEQLRKIKIAWSDMSGDGGDVAVLDVKVSGKEHVRLELIPMRDGSSNEIVIELDGLWSDTEYELRVASYGKRGDLSKWSEPITVPAVQ